MPTINQLVRKGRQTKEEDQGSRIAVYAERLQPEAYTSA